MEYYVDPAVRRFEQRILARGILSIKADPTSNRRGRRARRKADAAERAAIRHVEDLHLHLGEPALRREGLAARSGAPGERRFAGGILYEFSTQSAAAPASGTVIVPPSSWNENKGNPVRDIIEAINALWKPERWFRINPGPYADGTVFSPEAHASLEAQMGEAWAQMPPWMITLLGNFDRSTRLASMRYDVATKRWSRVVHGG